MPEAEAARFLDMAEGLTGPGADRPVDLSLTALPLEDGRPGLFD